MWNWVRRGNAYLASSRWPAVRFQPILYVFLFGACLRLAINQGEPPRFTEAVAAGFYRVWLAIGIISPLLSFASWVMIEKRSGITRFMGMWFRLAADIGVLTALVTFHAADTIGRPPGWQVSESHLFSRYIFGAATIFTLFLVVRDMWALILTEHLAGKIHRESER